MNIRCLPSKDPAASQLCLSSLSDDCLCVTGTTTPTAFTVASIECLSMSARRKAFARDFEASCGVLVSSNK